MHDKNGITRIIKFELDKNAYVYFISIIKFARIAKT